MIKHIWSILCKESIINQDDNNLSLIDVLEQLQVVAVPQGEVKETEPSINVPINYELVTFLTRIGDWLLPESASDGSATAAS